MRHPAGLTGDADRFPSQGGILDANGRPVDATSWKWLLQDEDTDRVLDWTRLGLRNGAILEAAVTYLAEVLKTRSGARTFATFEAIRLFAETRSFRNADRDGAIIPFKCVTEARETLTSSLWRIGAVRRWYAWAADHGYPAFSPEVAFLLEGFSFGRNAEARAVRSLDPASGPLDDMEVAALQTRLRAAPGDLTAVERAALWLGLGLGANTLQYSLLQEGDLERLEDPDEEACIYLLRVLRMKKREGPRRSTFRTRRLSTEIGRAVEEAITENRAYWRSMGGLPQGVAVNIFPARRVDDSRLGGALHEYATVLKGNAFIGMLAGAVAKLGVVSPRTGRPLHITSRRLRYTFATRLVRDGASQREVADALDHSDLQSVQCYFDLRSHVVPKLDKAMALELAPLAQAFLGKLVRTETQAVRGDDHASRIYHLDRDGLSARPVGTCGSFSFCGLAAPLACYTCTSFQPWVEAPHTGVLDALLKERERKKAAGMHERMVALHDVTILAVADVVTRVAEASGGTPA